jgi:N-terminal domain of (some) glycogen debranching enzymes/Mannosylglycerate hydrolase MGH1-like glycoside hydrolase domain
VRDDSSVSDTAPKMIPQHRQPFLQDAIVLVAAPMMAICDRSGQFDGTGVGGLFTVDRRLLSRLVVMVDGRLPEPIHAELTNAASARFVGVLRHKGLPTPDPTIRVERRRFLVEQPVEPGEPIAQTLHEVIRLSNAGREPQQLMVEVEVATDLAGVSVLSGGTAGLADVLGYREDGGLMFASRGLPGWTVFVRGERPADRFSDHTFEYDLHVPAGGSAEIRLQVSSTVPEDAIVVWPGPRDLVAPHVSSSDGILAPLVARSIDDLAHLQLADPWGPQDVFFGAGAPWYLTLFGRDALISARFALPLGWERAASTLRVLGRRQAHQRNVRAASEPGKILHELRAASSVAAASPAFLPPVYYGSIDSTPLWILLLHDAWLWGMPDAEVDLLMPVLAGAVDWLLHESDADGDGLLEYIDKSGHGLANQGWKDSGDSVQNRDGTLAEPPVALCEVQGYAFQAALAAADLMERFGGSEGATAAPGELRAFAERLRKRFHEAFWLADEAGDYLALALDGHKQPVTAVASNAGHVVASGLLDETQIAAVASRLTSAELNSGFGLRTMGTGSAGFNPIGYHTGSVWTHDTAFVIAELAKAGQAEAARTLIDGLLTASPGFDHRFPELYGGDATTEATAPMPYPASCRPQAWAAASAIAILTALLGIRPDVPRGRVVLAPLGLAAGSLDGLDVLGLRIGAGILSVRIRGSEVEVLEAPTGIDVVVSAS